VSVYLNRLTGFDHQCRVRYSVVLGDSDRRLDSGIMDDVSDTDGKGYGWHPRTRFNDLVYKVGAETVISWRWLRSQEIPHLLRNRKFPYRVPVTDNQFTCCQSL
jgi:hypothetical protein